MDLYIYPKRHNNCPKPNCPEVTKAQYEIINFYCAHTEIRCIKDLRFNIFIEISPHAAERMAERQIDIIKLLSCVWNGVSSRSYLNRTKIVYQNIVSIVKPITRRYIIVITVIRRNKFDRPILWNAINRWIDESYNLILEKFKKHFFRSQGGYFSLHYKNFLNLLPLSSSTL